MFTVDEKVRRDISSAKKQYYEAVSPSCKKKIKTQKKVASGAAGLTAVCSPGTGPADFVLRLHGFRKSCHQTEKAASGHVCPTGVAAGIL